MSGLSFQAMAVSEWSGRNCVRGSGSSESSNSSSRSDEVPTKRFVGWDTAPRAGCLGCADKGGGVTAQRFTVWLAGQRNCQRWEVEEGGSSRIFERRPKSKRLMECGENSPHSMAPSVLVNIACSPEG